MEASPPRRSDTVRFTITGQAPEQTFDAKGPGGIRWRIDFETPSGVAAYVELPESEYNAENVARVIAAKVQQIEAVHALTSGPA